jgi:hypothetical protein
MSTLTMVCLTRPTRCRRSAAVPRPDRGPVQLRRGRGDVPASQTSWRSVFTAALSGLVGQILGDREHRRQPRPQAAARRHDLQGTRPAGRPRALDDVGASGRVRATEEFRRRCAAGGGHHRRRNHGRPYPPEGGSAALPPPNAPRQGTGARQAPGPAPDPTVALRHVGPAIEPARPPARRPPSRPGRRPGGQAPGWLSAAVPATPTPAAPAPAAPATVTLNGLALSGQPCSRPPRLTPSSSGP